MKLPWKKKIEQKEERIQELQERIEKLEEERDSYRKRFEAEKERRSKLAAGKQDAEEKLNRLKDRLESMEGSESQPEEEEPGYVLEREDFDDALDLIRKLGSVSSPDKDMLTVYSPGEVDDVEDFRGLKNAVNPDQLEKLRSTSSFAAFIDPELGTFLLKTRSFFPSEWSLGDGFDTSALVDFIEEEKTWVLVSAGETLVYEEQGGSYEELERITSRVDRKHSKGGFSQDRFERKRNEQVEQHLEEVREVLQEKENIYLLGQKSLCEDLPGQHLGGFDPNRGKPEVFYSFQRLP